MSSHGSPRGGFIEAGVIITIGALVALIAGSIATFTLHQQSTDNRTPASSPSGCFGSTFAECTNYPGCRWEQQFVACSGRSESQCTNGCQKVYQSVQYTCSGAPGSSTCPAGCPVSTQNCAQYGQAQCYGQCSWRDGYCTSHDDYNCQGLDQSQCQANGYRGCGWVNPSCNGSFSMCNGTVERDTYVGCTGQQSTGYACVGTPLIPTATNPPPSSTPRPPSPTTSAASACENAAGRCWPTTHVCSTSTILSPSCGSGFKCVPEAASCSTPTPTRPPATATPIPCAGTCLPQGEFCHQAGSGACTTDRFCCSAVNAPTPTTNPNAPNPTRAPGTTCEDQYAGRCVPTNQVCSTTTTYSADCTLGFKCVPEAATCAPPTPTRPPNTPTPNLNNNPCVDSGRRCVPTSQTCNPSTIYSAYSCGSGYKCVAEGASCSSPTPTNAPASSTSSSPTLRQVGQSCSDPDNTGHGNCASGLNCTSLPGGKFCVNPQPSPTGSPDPQGGFYRCSTDSDHRYRQQYQNGQWVNIARCDAGCNTGTNNCNVACAPLSTRCSSDLLETCAANGSGWTARSCTYGCNASTVSTSNYAWCRPQPISLALSPTAPPIQQTQAFGGTIQLGYGSGSAYAPGTGMYAQEYCNGPFDSCPGDYAIAAGYAGLGAVGAIAAAPYALSAGSSVSTAAYVYGSVYGGAAVASVPVLNRATSYLGTSQGQNLLQTGGLALDAGSYAYYQNRCNQGNYQSCQLAQDIAYGNMAGLQATAWNPSIALPQTVSSPSTSQSNFRSEYVNAQATALAEDIRRGGAYPRFDAETIQRLQQNTTRGMLYNDIGSNAIQQLYTHTNFSPDPYYDQLLLSASTHVANGSSPEAAVQQVLRELFNQEQLMNTPLAASVYNPFRRGTRFQTPAQMITCGTANCYQQAVVAQDLLMDLGSNSRIIMGFGGNIDSNGVVAPGIAHAALVTNEGILPVGSGPFRNTSAVRRAAQNGQIGYYPSLNVIDSIPSNAAYADFISGNHPQTFPSASSIPQVSSWESLNQALTNKVLIDSSGLAWPEENIIRLIDRVRTGVMSIDQLPDIPGLRTSVSSLANP